MLCRSADTPVPPAVRRSYFVHLHDTIFAIVSSAAGGTDDDIPPERQDSSDASDQTVSCPSFGDASPVGGIDNGIRVQIGENARVDEQFAAAFATTKDANPELVQIVQRTPTARMTNGYQIQIGGQAKVGKSITANKLVF